MRLQATAKAILPLFCLSSIHRISIEEIFYDKAQKYLITLTNKLYMLRRYDTDNLLVDSTSHGSLVIVTLCYQCRCIF
jgi:hypothetical protein